MASRVELVSLTVIALAILIGGVPLLLTIARGGRFALVALAVLAFFQIAILRRDFAARTAQSRMFVTRDITYVAAIACAAIFVTNPMRWASGATIAATEFGLVLEVLSRFGQSSTPTPPNAEI